ncbi:thioesterase II family protein [Streptomyces sp. NPDC059740]|uniref:thioesterase II family protein n=1 Tax=Streptomyces sp. NPDC059740 TaxID=3346926 RepID=UPI0036558C4B
MQEVTAVGERRAPGTPYLPSLPPPGSRKRLFCFHPAGGGASVFSGLRTALAGRVEVVGVQLPGREGRRAHPLPATMAELVAELDSHLDPHLSGAYAFYGHSMGALVAHDLVLRRQRRRASTPARLVAAACRAPQRGAAFADRAEADDQVLIRTMLDIGGLSPELLRYPDWLRAAVDLTRGDLRLCAGRESAHGELLECPVDVFHATSDPLVSETDAEAWRERTAAACTVHRFEGGHFFFLRDCPQQFAEHLALTVLGGPQHRSAGGAS